MNKELLVKKERAFEIAHQNRVLEVKLFWKRALFYWGFVSVTFLAYISTSNVSFKISMMAALFGLISAFIWTLANRGSKYWQEYWERKVESLENDVVGNLFVDDTPYVEKKKWFNGKKFSVSRLSIAISDYLVFMWSSIVLYEISSFFELFKLFNQNILVIIYVLISFSYIIFIYFSCKSRVEKKQYL